MPRFTQLISIVLVLGLSLGCASRQSNNTSDSAQTQSVSGPPVAVQETIPFSEDADVRQAVKDQCELQTKTPNFVKVFGRRNGIDVQLVDNLDKTDIDRKLYLTITEAHAPAGGGFSGLKWMIVDGELHENGKKIADVKSRRNTTGGYFAAYKGTCDIIGRSTEAIGQDLANWLKDPRDDARLGDL